MTDFSISDEEYRRLMSIHKRTSDRRRADRIKAVLWLAKVWIVEDVAEILMDDVTVCLVGIRNKKYREGGEDRLILMRNKWTVSNLNQEQQLELREHLIHHTYLCSKDIAYCVEQT